MHPLCFGALLPEGAKHVVCDITETHCVAVGKITEGPNEKCPFSCQQIVAFFSTNGIWENAIYVPQPSSKLGNLNALACGDDVKNCVAVGYEELNHHFFDRIPFIISTQDGGNHWTLNTHSFGENICLYVDFPFSTLNAVSCDTEGMHCVAVGNCKSSAQNKDYSFSTTGLSVITEDSGITFHDSRTQPLPQGYNNELLNVLCNNDFCKASGFSSNKGSRWETIYISTNSGNDWQ